MHTKNDIDILISNAGIMEGGPIAEQPLELIRSMFEVNVFGALELAQGFIKNLLLKNLVKLYLPHRWEAYGLFLICCILCLKTCTGSHCRRTENRTGTIWY